LRIRWRFLFSLCCFCLFLLFRVFWLSIFHASSKVMTEAQIIFNLPSLLSHSPGPSLRSS
jgi:Na+-driven multidrug efflux pump